MATAVEIIDPTSYLTEAQVEAAWPVLKPGELRRARKSNQIEFFAFPSGPRYTASAVQEYINHRYRRTPAWRRDVSQEVQQAETPRSDGPMADITSTAPTPSEAETSTPAGMTPQLAQSVAEACAQRLEKRRRGSSLSLSQRPRRSKAPKHLTLVT